MKSILIKNTSRQFQEGKKIHEPKTVIKKKKKNVDCLPGKLNEGVVGIRRTLEHKTFS